MNVTLDELALTSEDGFHVGAEFYPTPASLHAKHRRITLTVFADNTEARDRLTEKVQKIAREGGTLRRTLQDGDAVTFDLLSAEMDDDCLKFTAKPFGRGEI